MVGRRGSWLSPAVRRVGVDVLAVCLCIGAMCVDLVQSSQAETTASAVLVIVLAALPILVRRLAPVVAFVLAMGMIFAVLSFSGIYITITGPAMICGYTLAAARGVWAASAAAAAALPTAVLMMVIYSPHPLIDWETVKNLAFVAVPLALGTATHDRRAYTAALVERAESAEQSREDEARRRASEERLRIARDVHDVVAHAMVAINVQSGVGAHLVDRDPSQARSALRDIKRLSGEALVDLRSILGLLRENETDVDDIAPTRPAHGLVLDDLRESFSLSGIELDVEIDPAIRALPAAVGVTGYRIVQEALTNVMRHVGPTSARVRVTQRDDMVEIEVDNDHGAGPVPPHHAGSGNGLRGMHERAVAAGGSLDAGPLAGGGWRVAASLPIEVGQQT